MRDQFVGDVGDLGKYGLLRYLTRQDLKLGVVWHYRPDVSSEDSDPLDLAECRDADAKPYDTLQGLTHGGERFFRCVEGSDSLLASTKCFRDMLDYPGIPPGAPRRLFRCRRLHDGLQRIEDADVVYLDPDEKGLGRHGRRRGMDSPGPRFSDDSESVTEVPTDG